jgi:SH3-like domain-containing protein
MRTLVPVLAVVVAVLVASPGEGLAQDGETRGPVTNLPLPRFVSLKAAEGNLRRGPGLGHRIDWVLKRRGMPLEITAEYGHWRRVQDQDGVGGWIHYALLSGERTVLVEEDMVPLRAKPEKDAVINARAEFGVIGHLGQCNLKWCEISADGYSGWVRKTTIWGVGADEIRN